MRFAVASPILLLLPRYLNFPLSFGPPLPELAPAEPPPRLILLYTISCNDIYIIGVLMTLFFYFASDNT